MMVRRIALIIPILALFGVTSLIFLAARAPRTWSTHWTSPRTVIHGSGAYEYGIVRSPTGGWDLLWLDDDTQQMRFTDVSGSGPGSARTVSLDQGDVLQPSLLRIGHRTMGVWIHNRNGSTDLMAAWLVPGHKPVVFRLIGGSQPIEHPFLFRGFGDKFDVIFSWQRYNNYDLFLATLPPLGTRPARLTRLTHAQYYSFYPRAAADRTGNINVLHLESCCRQQVWDLMLDRFDRFGHRLAPGRILYRDYSYAQSRALPAQWGEDFVVDSHGDTWGAFGGGQGAQVFMLDPAGRMTIPPTSVDLTGNLPAALSLVVERNTGYLFWQQPFDLGSFIDSQQFDSRLRLVGRTERTGYESGTQTNPVAFVVGGRPTLVWQSGRPSGQVSFESSRRRSNGQPTLAQRLGLGLGNPWEDLAVLLVTSVGIATITTTVNILVVFGLALFGFFAVRILSKVPGKWALYGLLLGVALYLTFVSPGGPTILLTTMPSMGLRSLPFGLVATFAAAATIIWLGVVVLRRLEDLYRAGIMALAGVYFFAFVEAIVFIQQRLGYI